MKNFKGENNPNWSNAKLRSICGYCEQGFLYFKNTRRGKYCSWKCFVASGFARKSQNARFLECQGKTPAKQRIKTSLEYREWRSKIMRRDRYQCVLCQSKKILQVDHIVPFSALYQEYIIIEDSSALFDIDNGRVLCKECHLKTDNYGPKSMYDPLYKLVLTIRRVHVNYAPVSLVGFYRNTMETIIERVKKELDDAR